MRVTESVTSVWPPIISTFADFAARLSSSATPAMSLSVVLGGASSVTRSPIGSAPAAAASLQLTCTVSEPICLPAAVIGSVESTAIRPPRSTAAQSTPTCGEQTTSLRVWANLFSISSLSVSLSSLPILIVLSYIIKKFFFVHHPYAEAFRLGKLAACPGSGYHKIRLFAY